MAAPARRLRRFVPRWLSIAASRQPPRHAGTAGAIGLCLASLAYGAVQGGHVPAILEALRDSRDAVANAAGFSIAAVSLSGEKQVSREAIFAAAGVTGRSSLLFLDVAAARARLLANPWIAEATVRKLYPDHLQIIVTERSAFALWQLGGKVSVIAADGTVVAALDDRTYAAFAALPFVVGAGAGTQAREFLALLDRYPTIRDEVRAAIRVAERRWNLKLKNGIDVRLPEVGADQALETLAALERDKHLLSRDLAAIDLRLPDRVTVRLADEVAKARDEALKDRKAKRKGGDA
jgi:cell division protein FtsQ